MYPTKALQLDFFKEIEYTHVKKIILDELKEIFDVEEPDRKVKGSSISGALSRALCFINRMEKEKPVGTTLNSRILTLQVSPDITEQYISAMNTIYSALRMVCILHSFNIRT